MPDLDTARCACGYVFDEHDEGLDCVVEVDGWPCACVHFEEDGDDD